MAKQKTAKAKRIEYAGAYANVPKQINQQLIHMLESNGYTEKDIEKVMIRKKQIMDGLFFNTMKIVLYEIPEASKRPRFTQNGFRFYVPGAAEHKNNMKVWVKGNIPDFKMISTPVIVDLVTYFPIPKNYSRVDKILAQIGFIQPLNPDWDNLGKTYTDDKNELVYIDDGLIIDGRSRKFYSNKPRIEVTIKWQNKYISGTQHKAMLGSTKYKEYDQKEAVQSAELL